jgi:hypothetical protein
MSFLLRPISSRAQLTQLRRFDSNRRSWANWAARIAQTRELLRKLEHLDKLLQLLDADTEDASGAGPTEKVNQPVRDHLPYLRVALLALAVDVNPDAETLLVGQGTVGHLDRDFPELRPALGDQRARIYPAAFAVDNSVFAGLLGMGLDQQRLEQALIRLDLQLEFFVLLRPRRGCRSFGTISSRSTLVRYVPQDRRPEPALLQTEAHDLAALGAAILGAGHIGHSSASAVPTMRRIWKRKSPLVFRIACRRAARRSQVLL